MPTAPKQHRPRVYSRTQAVRPSIPTVKTSAGLRVPMAYVEFVGTLPREGRFR